MVAVGLPLLAADTTREALPVAVVVAALHLPWMVVAAAGPTLTVRGDRRTIIGALDTMRTVAFAWLGAQALLGSVDIPTIAGVALIAGTAVAVVDDAEQEAAASVAADASADRAGGRLALPAVVSDGFLGIPAGALLFAVVPGAPFLVAAGSYTVAALLALTVLHAPGPATGAAATPPAPSAVARMAASPGVLVRGGVTVGVSLFGSVVAGPLVLVALDRLALDAVGVGVLLTAMAAGSLAGGVLAAELGARAGTVRALTAALLVGAAGYGVAGVVDRSLAAGGALTLASMASMAAMVLSRAGRPAHVLAERALHGVTWAAIPIGAVAGGLLAGAWGLGAPLLAAAAGLVTLVPLAGIAARPGPWTAPPQEAPAFAKIC